MADRRTNYANGFQTTLAAQMGPTALEAQVVSLAGGPTSPCLLTFGPDDPPNREYILFDGVFGPNTLVTTNLTNRYLAGSAAASGITHEVGTVVRMSPLKQHFDDLHDRVEGRLSAAGHTRALHESLGITNQALTTAERDALDPASLFVGRAIFNTTKNLLEIWDGGKWNAAGSGVGFATTFAFMGS